MNERAIFQGALEYSDPAQRHAYLDHACGGDAALRARIESLLVSHDSASQFLNVPALEQLNPGNQGRLFQTIDFPQTGGAQAAAGDDDIPENEPLATPDLSFLSPSSKPGSLGVLGHYEILNLLGQGAFGLVFRAFDEKLHRQVAIKVMNPQVAATSPPRKRFLREARSAAAIRHENIVQVYSVEEQPLPYLVMEYVEGQTLQSKLDRSGPLDVAEILHLGRQMANGLAAAHTLGLIHRDIKPGNILIEAGTEQKVKITDFGLARAADDATLTRTGVISGTPGYMAPEQAQGLALDHRADLFSLGSVLYQMASGRLPFRGPSTIAVLKRVVEETPRPVQEIIPEVPDWLCRIITKLHAKDPNDRFQSSKEVAVVLSNCQEQLQQHGPVKLPLAFQQSNAASANATPAAPEDCAVSDTLTAEPKSHPARRHWATAAAVLLALLATISLTEAMGVTNVRGTVVRLFSPDGTLIVEVDDPNVRVSRETVTQSIPPTIEKIDRRPQFRMGGEWRIEGDELVQSSPNNAAILFGDRIWTDYDFEVELNSQGKTRDGHGAGVLFRATDLANFFDFQIGGWSATVSEVTFMKNQNWGRVPGTFLQVPHEHHRWYKCKVEVRGAKIRCTVDGKELFVFEDADHLKGMVGLSNGNSPVRWRNLKVKAPDGRVLWEGFPDLDTVAPKTALPPPDFAAAPFDEQKAKQLQENWARYLNRNVFEENSVGIKLTLIPPGQFEMGINEDEKDGNTGFKIDPAEKPQHTVTLTRPYLLSATEVTQEQFAKIMGRNLSSHNALGQHAEQVKDVDTAKLPVEWVSWFDAIEFCNKLSEKEGLPSYYELTFPVRHKDGEISVADVKVLGGMGYRLPTEAEWEYAGRAGTTTPFSFPFDYGTLGQYGWFGYIERTHAVGERKPNPFGLHDMHGNVHEWCFDWFGPYAGDSLSDPTGPSTGTERVCRGGAYNYLPPYARSAWRGKSRPGARLDNTGLRVARFVAERASKASHTEQ